MPLKNGDFILLDYVAKVKETGEAFDVTIEDVAKREGLYKEGQVYEPKLVVIGEGWMLKAVEEALLKSDVGRTEVVEVPPEKAFGPRDPTKVKLIPLRRLAEKGVSPRIGMRVEYEGKLAIVRSVGGGRVQLDFNPPLAGKTLVYEVMIKKKLKTKREKVAALVHRRMPTVDVEKFKLRFGKASVIIEMPEEAFYIEGIQVAKRGIALDVQKFFPRVNDVKFIETFKRQT